MARLIDTRAVANKIHEYMEDFPRSRRGRAEGKGGRP